MDYRFDDVQTDDQPVMGDQPVEETPAAPEMEAPAEAPVEEAPAAPEMEAPAEAPADETPAM